MQAVSDGGSGAAAQGRDCLRDEGSKVGGLILEARKPPPKVRASEYSQDAHEPFPRAPPLPPLRACDLLFLCTPQPRFLELAHGDGGSGNVSTEEGREWRAGDQPGLQAHPPRPCPDDNS